MYDAWGMPIGKNGALSETLGTLNPFRYRGYVFDEETGLMIGKIKIGNFSLGVSGGIFSGIIIGYFVTRWAQGVQEGETAYQTAAGILKNGVVANIFFIFFLLCIFVVNMAYMLVFKSLEGGLSNPLSILWAITYYIFWCAFYRYYYHLKPYIFSKTLLGSMAPSSKALVLMFVVLMSLAMLPMLPLFLGVDDAYMEHYERYMSAIENLSDGVDIGVSFVDIFIIFTI